MPCCCCNSACSFTLQEGAQCGFRMAADSVKASRTSAEGAAAGQAHDLQQANWNSSAASPGSHGANSSAGTWGGQQQQQQQQQGFGYGSYQQESSHNGDQQQYGSTPGAGAQGYDNGLPPGVEAPNCDCGLPAAFRTSNSERNPGRQFFGCSKRMDEPGRCKYFCWLDQLGKSPAGRSRPSLGGQAATGV